MPSAGACCLHIFRHKLMVAATAATTHLQDIMRLDNSARMNTPGKAAGNWAWRVGGPDVWEKLAEETKQLKQLAYVYDRMPKGTKEIDY